MDVSIIKNNGTVNIGDQFFLCCCGGGCTKENLGVDGIEGVLPENDVNGHEQKICECHVPKQTAKLAVDSSQISKLITDVVRDRNCPHFEMHLKIRSSHCKICQGESTGHLPSLNETYSSQEFELNLPHPTQSSLKQNKNTKLSDVTRSTNFEANRFAFKGNFIHLIAKVDENGTKITFKYRLDVRRSSHRRCQSFSDIVSLRKQVTRMQKSTEKSKSCKNVHKPVWSKSSTSLYAATSCITIDELAVDVSDLSNIVPKQYLDVPTDLHVPTSGIINANCESEISQQSEISHPAIRITNVEETSDIPADAVDNVDAFDLENLKKQAVFAQGQFGPVYKTTKDNQDILVKVVGDNREFLEEAKQFINCIHPFVRSTAAVVENGASSYVIYRFVAGETLCQAIQNESISDYITYFRILFGIVKGLSYLGEKRIQCRFLTSEKILLDGHSNPRICGVGLAYFDNTEHAGTNVDDFHRSLSYLDQPLRSSKVKHPKNVMWSIGRIIWEMLFGRISQSPGDEDLLEKYHILEHLNETCDDKKIKTSYFTPELRKIVYAKGWPKDKEITKSLVVCAIRCMLLNLHERMSLDGLYAALEIELCELRKREKFLLYRVLPDNQCIFCMTNKRDQLALTCGCTTACNECLRNAAQLDCPEHGKQFSKIGHPLTYGVIIQGDFHEVKDMCDNDSNSMECLYCDQNTFAIKNFDRIKSKTEKDACKELDNVKKKIMDDKKATNNDCCARTLVVFIAGHCNEHGNLILPDKSILKKKNIYNFIQGVNAKNVVVFANGHYSEKLVKYLFQVRSNFLNSCALFGVFSHAGSLCSMSLENVCDKNSATVKFILDIFKKGESSTTASDNSVARKHLTIEQLVQLVNERMREACGKSLQPIERNGGGHIPVAYL